MELGIFAKTFVRSSLEETLDAVQGSGLNGIQFNMACAGLPSMPDQVETETAARVRAEAGRRKLAIHAVSGTYNMAHPDPEVRRLGLVKLRNLAAVCGTMGTSVITLCTGSRDPDHMWRRHPANDSQEAWDDMTASMEQALEIAEAYQVTLAIEPEAANIVSDAGRAQSLLRLMQSERLKVVMDAANLFHPGNVADMKGVLHHAFELLGEQIVLAHAKDFTAGDELSFVAAGQGMLDYDCYISLLRSASFDGPLIMHGLGETQVAASTAFLHSKLGM
ncbi:sugar phosphate isomerase/epimerase family protein [Paenibacillus piri]|uniref:Sugar phosphate isomerase/epimerase n=1 Tax=Paenibacillus piri TaxID=2547395 RepID=A0A4R5KV64_9BACL|nr:sugar phosphate isomerase/epimerase [Paenibacillus piri]TDF98847.1 sugar phosphate isomerase/epimerase [Paenibacillus piri]